MVEFRLKPTALPLKFLFSSPVLNLKLPELKLFASDVGLGTFAFGWAMLALLAVALCLPLNAIAMFEGWTAFMWPFSTFGDGDRERPGERPARSKPPPLLLATLLIC